MTRLGAEFIVEIDGVLTDRDVLGKCITIEGEGEAWCIELPEHPDSFPLASSQVTIGDSKDVDPREYAPVALVDNGQSFVDVRVLRIVVNFDGDLSIETFDPEHDGSTYQHYLTKYQNQALAFATDFTSRLRLELDQVGVKPAGEFPKLVGALRLHDLDAGLQFGTVIFRAGVINVVDSATFLTTDALESLERTMGRGRLDPEEVLLSEARYLEQSDEAGAADRATLLAAIAVELKTKRVLRDIASDNSEALELLIEHPRDWSMAVHGLYLKALPIFAGGGLGEEHRASAKEVQRLFTERNAIAHKGKAITPEDCKAHVVAALTAFRILNEVRDGVMSTPGGPGAA